MHHKNSINSILFMGGFLALSLAACDGKSPDPYPTTTTMAPGGATTTTMAPGGVTTTTAPPVTTTTARPTTTTTAPPVTTTTARPTTTTTSSTTTTTRSTTTTLRPPAPVVLNGFQFTPSALTIRAGQTVTWSHQQPGVFHTVTSDTAVFDSRGGNPTLCPFGTPTPSAACLENGETFSRTFASPGTFPYHCVVHGAPGGAGMSGTITVNP